MEASDLRVALVSGNYNMVLDGPTQALNRLVGHVMGLGGAVRVFAPTVRNPQVEAVGEVISVPSVAIPGRSEYRVPLGLMGKAKERFESFRPNLVHVASPDRTSRQAVDWARKHGVPVLGSVHTRFETYPRYYHLGFLEPAVEAWLRAMYRRCDALVAPSEGMVDVLRSQNMNDDIGIWTRGIDREVFHPGARDMAWRRELGFGDDEVVISFLGRLVMEKGLDVFADTIIELRRRQVPHRVMVIGDGPARGWFEKALPGGVFVGHQAGKDLGRAVASADVFFNPSITETFGNVTLEHMACGKPVVAANATGSSSLVADGETGVLVTPGDVAGFADALAPYCTDADLRARHGAAGLERSRPFTWEAINASMVDTYLRLANAKPQAAVDTGSA
ncbi:glycosyltransferase family 4 protein [Alteriqipengyuania lutimaris]|uniref:Glycosyltransferase family 1 protein n=1 Tax=Alteriqipengyuania lutimaris TaxID=1538146 RepID=A0A395LKX1_9SPHN|nr:glycosyltransferase family 1 protein [Alteriqipengyuania lutimaris]MBB3033352.1 glycosyltransferase involved in cell wall biosynthesis [Alteriqipengyuania lutimaris]RDS77618.1 glycosyltransferase family 1 protein [Alteriqipengyuania lutimaris]